MLSIKPQLKKKYQKVSLRSNHYGLKMRKDKIGLRFDLEISNAKNGGSLDEIDYIVHQCKEALGKMFGWFEVSGKTLYTFKQLGKSTPLPTKGDIAVRTLVEEDGFSLSLPKEKDGSPGKMLYLVKTGRELVMSDLHTPHINNRCEIKQFSNIWFGSLMKDLGFNELGGFSGRYFDTSKPMGTALGELDVYSGYKISPEVYFGTKPKLLLDRQTRVVSKTTLLDEWNYSKQKPKQLMDRFAGNSFVHIPTNKNVRIVGFDLKKKPNAKYTTSEFANYADYYKKALGVKKIDMKQFLVYSVKRSKAKNDKGEMEVIRERTYYLPQFLRMTGMTDFQRNNHKMMKAVAEFTKLEPERRENE
jgi:hypothetical protein